MYSGKYSRELTKKLAKLKKKNFARYEKIDKKIKEILEKPKHEYKNLRYDMGGFKRVQIGHFVLIFRVDHQNKIVWFDDYDHHDRIYKK